MKYGEVYVVDDDFTVMVVGPNPRGTTFGGVPTVLVPDAIATMMLANGTSYRVEAGAMYFLRISLHRWSEVE